MIALTVMRSFSSLGAKDARIRTQHLQPSLQSSVNAQYSVFSRKNFGLYCSVLRRVLCVRCIHFSIRSADITVSPPILTL
jgi:hypothetical protein